MALIDPGAGNARTDRQVSAKSTPKKPEIIVTGERFAQRFLMNPVKKFQQKIRVNDIVKFPLAG